jgi:hypothetical protein
MNPYVAAWTLIATIGVLFSLILGIESILDLRALGDVKNGRRWHVRGRIASEAIRFIVHGAFLVLGVALISAPTGDPSPLVIVLLFGNVLLIVNSAIAFYIRRVTEARPPAQILAQAEQTAGDLLDTAKLAATDLVDLAAREADSLRREEPAVTRVADAAERTAVNTERIAENTEPRD